MCARARARACLCVSECVSVCAFASVQKHMCAFASVYVCVRACVWVSISVLVRRLVSLSGSAGALVCGAMIRREGVESRGVCMMRGASEHARSCVHVYEASFLGGRLRQISPPTPPLIQPH